MQNSFVYNQAGIDALNTLAQGQQDNATYTAQLDLLKYMFSGAIPSSGVVSSSNTYYERISSVLNQVKTFDTNGDGSYTPRPEGDLPADEVIVYCDYSRFVTTENDWESAGCNASEYSSEYACDKDTGVAILIDDRYKECQENTFGVIQVRRHLQMCSIRCLTMRLFLGLDLKQQRRG